MSRSSFDRLARFAGTPRAATIAVIGFGAILRVWHYVANNSLWIDEAALARNIIDRPIRAVLDHLDYAQSAPPGFLLIEKAVVSMFGTSEYALRAFPLVSGLLGLFVFLRVAERVLTGWEIPYAVGLFSLAMPFTFFSAQVKPYSTDVTVAIVLLHAAIVSRAPSPTSARSWRLGLVGATAVWFSLPALFVLAGIGLSFAVLIVAERDGRSARLLLTTAALWAISSAAAALHALHAVSRSDREYFQWFWAAGFMPMPPSFADAIWLFGKVTSAFGTFGAAITRLTGGLNYQWPAAFTVVALAGVWALFKTRRDVALFASLPFAVTAAVSAAAVYPLTGRLMIFLLPALLLCVAAGASYLLRVWPRRLGFLIPVGFLVLVGSPVYTAIATRPPYWLQHVRPILEFIQAHQEPGDTIYVSDGASQAFHYYAPRIGLGVDDTVYGACDDADPRAYLRELDTLRGRSRVWVVFTHSRLRGRMAAYQLDYLERIGRRVDGQEEPGTSGRPLEGAYGFLYDLRPTRFTSSSWDTYPIEEGFVDGPGRWGCYGIFDATPKLD